MNDINPCAILSIGTELVRGDVRDAHLAYLAKELRTLGFGIGKETIVPDDMEIVITELERTTAEFPFLIVTGGLGPTSDDITRDAIARAASAPLEYREELWEHILKRLSGSVSGDSNRRQAYIPAGFTAIENTIGTACGFYGTIRSCTVVVLPGPPRELQRMFSLSVTPLLESVSTPEPKIELEFSVFLTSESLIEDVCTAVEAEGITHRTRLEEDRVIVTFVSTLSGINADIESSFVKFADAFGSFVVKRGNQSSVMRVMEALKSHGETVCLAESCTGGLIGEWLTNIPGSSKFFWGGCTVYSNESKSALLGIDPALIEREGAVSRDVVSAMAEGALRISSAGYAIAVSGIAGPAGGNEQKPVGTIWISVRSRRGREITRCFHFSGDRSRIRKKAATCGLLLCEFLIAEKDTLDIKEGKW